jgi:hypothetical protein
MKIEERGKRREDGKKMKYSCIREKSFSIN